ncbi:GbsR/MarR family transcriptional regulator [Aliikangiella maris]|uniref:Transcriptional regulator n=2 Tax=Aliikangiella maris TaxID=3162458 RepID=A0ABV3MSK1_9GAMM
MELPCELETVVVHFGEMGSRWGFNRTVGQMFAVIVFTEAPLNAEQIAKMLSISRGNVSMGIKELQSWQLIRVHHIPGDRKEYFKPAGTIWELALQVLSERRKREVEPTLSLLRSHMMSEQQGEHPYANQQIKEIYELIELFTNWFDDIHKMNSDSLKTLLKLGAGVGKVLDLKDKLSFRKGESS